MSTRRILPHAPRSAFAATVLAVGEVVVDEDTGTVYAGDGVTPGGVISGSDTPGFIPQAATGSNDIDTIIVDGDPVPTGDFREFIRPVSQIISLGDRISVSTSSALPGSIIGKTVDAVDGPADYQITLPTGVPNGSCVRIAVAWENTRLVAVATSAGTIDGQATRIMWRGEIALLRKVATGWRKEDGITIPFRGFLSASAATTATVASTFTPIQLATAGGDYTGLNLCHDATNKRFKAPRGGAFQFDINVRIEAATAALSQFYVGLSYQDPNTVFGHLFDDPQLNASGVYRSMFGGTLAINRGDWLAPSIRYEAPATGVTAPFTATLKVPSLSFSEIVSW